MLIAAICGLSGTAVDVSPAGAQRLPVNPGDHVRVAITDSAALGRWLHGSVLAATRLGVVLTAGSFGADTVPVSLNPAVRLQLRRRSSGRLLLGTALGLGVGLGAGALVPANTLGAWWGERTPGHRAEMVYFGLAGTMLGWLATWFLAPPRWEEVPLSANGIVLPAAPVRRAPGSARFGRLERWQPFAATDADFAAFFWEHRDSLRPIEGLWQPMAWRDSGFAIVQDARYPGWEYIAVPYARAAYQVGHVAYVLRATEKPGTYELRDTEGPGPGYEVTLRGDVLDIRGFTTAPQEWVRQRLLPP